MWNVVNNEGEPKRDSFIVPYIPVDVSFVFATPLKFHRNAVLQGTSHQLYYFLVSWYYAIFFHSRFPLP